MSGTRPASLLLVLALLAAPRAQAQPPPQQKQQLPCALEMWSCMAGCIDSRCLQRCVAPCAGAIRGLRRCLREARCAPEDTACWRNACPEACGRVFAAVRGTPAASAPARCEPQTAQAFELPEEWVGRWEMTGASFVRQSEEREDQFVRADFGLRLRIASPGCFELETRLGGATLGAGNALTLRLWGQLVMRGEDEWEAIAAGGSLTGQLCGEPRNVALSNWAGRSVTRVRCTVDHGALLLSSLRVPDRYFSFERIAE